MAYVSILRIFVLFAKVFCTYFKSGSLPATFSFISVLYKLYLLNVVNEWAVNHGPLVLVATALPAEPPPLPLVAKSEQILSSISHHPQKFV